MMREIILSCFPARVGIFLSVNPGIAVVRSKNLTKDKPQHIMHASCGVLFCLPLAQQ